MLKIAVFGTGGVGGIFGILFAQAGHDVHFIARGEHLKAMQTQGLSLHSAQGDFHLTPISATSHPEDIGPVDLVLVCVKTWQLSEAILKIEPLVGTHTLILPLLNGVEAVDLLAAKYSFQHVLRGFCAVISYIEGPGKIRQVGIPPYLCFGEANCEQSKVSSRTLKLNQELSVPQIVLETPEDILSKQWRKYIFISSLGVITSAIRKPASAFRQIPEARNLLKDAMWEVTHLGRKKGVELPDHVVEAALARVDEMPEGGTTSMQRDFAAGRRTELEAFSGYIVRESHRLGLDAPIHRSCYALLAPHEPSLSKQA